MNTTEEKARAIDIVKQMIVDGQVSQEVAEKYFPELKEESEDEKIRKEIIAWLQNTEGQVLPIDRYNAALAWLEKQNKSKEYTFKSIPRLLDMIEPTERAKAYTKKLIDTLAKEGYSTDAKIVEDCLKQMNGEVVAMAVMDEKQGEEEINDDDKAILENWESIVKENREKWQLSDWFVEATYLLIRKVKHANTGMQGEQKPADKVEPKFKVGDWITNSIETVQITGYDIDYGYQVDYKGNLQHRDTDIIEKEYHLWTIQDAKDGDVLQLGGVTAIFREYIGNGNCKCYCSVCNGEFEIPSQEGDDNSYGCYNAHPATKEQRDLLFAKMYEAATKSIVERR